MLFPRRTFHHTHKKIVLSFFWESIALGIINEIEKITRKEIILSQERGIHFELKMSLHKLTNCQLFSGTTKSSN